MEITVNYVFVVGNWCLYFLFNRE